MAVRHSWSVSTEQTRRAGDQSCTVRVGTSVVQLSGHGLGGRPMVRIRKKVVRKSSGRNYLRRRLRLLCSYSGFARCRVISWGRGKNPYRSLKTLVLMAYRDLHG